MPEDIPEEPDSQPPDFQKPKQEAAPSQPTQSAKDWFLRGLDMAVMPITDPARAWAGFKKDVFNMKGGFIIILLLLVAVIVHYADSMIYTSATPSKNFTASITNSSNSPVTQVNESSNVNVNNNSGNSSFSNTGNFTGSQIFQIGNNSKVTFNYYPTIVSDQITQIVYKTQSTSPDWEVFTNDVIVAGTSFFSNDFQSAYEHANEAIQYIERPNSDLITISTNAQFMGGIYLIAALSLDNLETNPQLAYDLIEKAVTFSPTRITTNAAAIIAGNLSPTFFKRKDYSTALKLSMEPIKAYESDPQWFNDYMTTNFSFIWYQRTAWLAANTGQFSEAEKYAAKAYQLHPSRDELEFFASILVQLGYRVWPMEKNPNRPPDGLFDIVLMRNDDYSNHIQRIYFLDTNNQMIGPIGPGLNSFQTP
jgi:tetratricopeptide (TPR) repeat protein